MTVFSLLLCCDIIHCTGETDRQTDWHVRKTCFTSTGVKSVSHSGGSCHTVPEPLVPAAGVGQTHVPVLRWNTQSADETLQCLLSKYYNSQSVVVMTTSSWSLLPVSITSTCLVIASLMLVFSPQCSWTLLQPVRSFTPLGGAVLMPSWRRFYLVTSRGNVMRRNAPRRRH